MSSTRKTIQLARLITRELSQSAPRSSQLPPRILKLKANQEKFGIENNIPVHLKGGLGDKLLYQFTTLVTLTGIGMSLHVFYRLTFK